jgi:stage II sporulation protein D
MQGDQVVFKGRGYGHGVGMSQWGAYKMAEEGKKAEEILSHYFQGIEIVNMWK